MKFQADVRRYTAADDIDDVESFDTYAAAISWVFGHSGQYRGWVNNVEVYYAGKSQITPEAEEKILAAANQPITELDVLIDVDRRIRNAFIPRMITNPSTHQEIGNKL